MGRLGVAGCGFVEVYFAFPGGGAGEGGSGGEYDCRGADSILALRDVIRFATGKTGDKQGRTIQNIVGNGSVLTANVGMVGSSHGGNACGAVMGLHGQDIRKLAWYFSWESPYGEGAVGAELGSRNGRLNPAYDPETGEIDLSKLAYDPKLAARSFGAARQGGASALTGNLFFDMDGDGICALPEDYPLQAPAFDLGEGPKSWYSSRLMREAERRGLFGVPRPAHVPTLDETVEFWRYRDATGLVPEAVRKLPRVAVIVGASETDHVQIAPDHPHIRAQVNAFQQAGAQFIRLNPDRAYLEWLFGKSVDGLPDNDAGLQYTPKTIRAALCPDDAIPKQLLTPASVCELADRVQAGNFTVNLDEVLFPDAPRTSRPPTGARPRPSANSSQRPAVRPPRNNVSNAEAALDLAPYIDLALPGPKPEVEPIELNANVGMESESRARDYTLARLPSGAPLPTLYFVDAGASGRAARITAGSGEAGALCRTVAVDKGERLTFSAKVRGEGIGSIELVVVPVERRAARMRRSPVRPETRSKSLSGSFDWTAISIDASISLNIDGVVLQAVVRGPGTVWIDDVSVKAYWPKKAEVPEKPLAPLLFMVLMHSETPQAYIQNRDYFKADALKYEAMAKMQNRYGGRLVAEPERELWLGAQRYDPEFIRRMHEDYGVSFSVHTHGPNPRNNPTPRDVLDYIELRKKEMEAMGSGPVTDLNGNFDFEDWDLFASIGIRSLTALKYPATQKGLEAYYRHPWRPTGSPYQGEAAWARHRPEGKIVYIPGAGAIHTRHHERFADLMERHLRVALNRVRADKLNTFYFVEHVGRFQARAGQSPLEYVHSKAFRDDLEQHERFLRDVVAPLVKSGHIQYTIPSEICDRFEAWEKKNPLKPPFNLDATDASEARSDENRRAIWKAYEKIVAYAAANLEVVTSEDLVKFGNASRSETKPIP